MEKKLRPDNGVGKRFMLSLRRDYQLYLLCLPAVVFILVFEYGSMYGVQLAFKNFDITKGIWGSPWVGLEHFRRFFGSYQFWILLKNTLVVSIYSVVAGFPIPIIMALVVNQIRCEPYKKFIQCVTYAPHFISVVVLGGMLIVFLSPSVGIVNNFLAAIGAERVYFLGIPSYWKHIFVWSDVWQNTGWNAIIYVAALAGINPELYEAARVDGAHELQIYSGIALPFLRPAWGTLLVFTFTSCWNDAASSLMYTANQNLRLLPVMLSSISESGSLARAGAAAAASFLIMLPSIVIFILQQRKVMETMAHSGIK